MNSVYCSEKFKELMIDIQSRSIFNCCKAYPERVDIKWLEENPGKLFYTPTMIADRQAMLEGKRTRACDHGCYQYEDQGLISARALADKTIISNPYNPMETLILALSTDCNLTCAYCDSSASTAWSKDIKENGEYKIEGYKNVNENWNNLWNKIKQSNRSINSKFFKLIIKEISLSPNIKDITLQGGEPLLNNQLLELIESIGDKRITIISGLGISPDRFKKIIDQLKNKENITFNISAESTGNLFEFLRYGSNWKTFLEYLDYLKKNKIKFRFISTITNLANFNFVEFYNMFSKEYNISYNPVSFRSFLQPNVLDDYSKELFLKETDDKKDDIFLKRYRTSLSQPFEQKEKEKLSSYLKQFSNRRNLKLDIFPEHFLKWLNLI